MFWKYKTSDLLDKAALITCMDLEHGKIVIRRFEKRNGEWGTLDNTPRWTPFKDQISLMTDFINSNHAINKDPKYYSANGNRLKVNFWGKIYETA